MTIGQLEPWPKGQPPAPSLRDDESRLRVLEAYDLDALNDDPELAGITRFAARLCRVPIAQVSLVEDVRQRFLAGCGLEARETPRSQSFCAHAMLQAEPMVVEDAAADPRFAGNPLVTGGPGIRFYAGAPLISPEGAPLGALCVIDSVARPGGLDDFQRDGLEVLATAVMRRLRSRRETLHEQSLRSDQMDRMRLIGDWLPDIIWSADAEGRFDYYNARWEQVTGGKPPPDAEAWRPFVHPEDHERAFGTWYDCAARGMAFEDEYRLLQADGSWRWTLSRALPLVGKGGSVLRWYGTLTDVDEAHRKLIGRELLSQELNHRIKNIFAVINGLIAIRAREHPEAQGFADELSATLMALSRAHNFVTREQEREGSSLIGLLHDLLAPYGGNANERVAIAGDDFELGRKSATPFALVFHELATNSAKYGALSAAEGRVAVACHREGERLAIEWRETGGPLVEAARTTGFGSRLVQLTVSSQLQGTLEREFRPEGLFARLTVPQNRL